ALLVGGSALMRGLGMTGWALPAFGFLAGVAMYLAVGFLQVVSGLPTTPVVALAVVAAVPTGWWAVRLARGGDARVPPVPAALVVAGVVLVVVALRLGRLVTWSFDSFWYVEIGRMLAGNTYRELVT